jgi:hypothetical protein
MNRFLISAAMIGALITPAHAVELPEQLGSLAGEQWCEEAIRSRDGWSAIRMTNYGDGCANASAFAIETNGFFGWEDKSCQPIRIGKEQGRGRTLEWMITARCTYYGEARERIKVEVFKFSLYKGSELTLHMRTGHR